MKKIIISMLTFACTSMMYGKIFVKPERYHFVQEKGYLNEKDYSSFNRQFLIKDISQSFNKQIDLWYETANESILLEEINKEIGNEINKNV